MSVFDLDDAPNWRGRDVIDRNGHAVGVITDLYVDEASGLPEWAGVRTGMFSHRVTFVPLSEATAHGLRVQVAFDQRQIHEAPNFDPGGHLTAEDEARLFRHYGLEHSPADGSGADSEFIAPATDRVEEEPPAGDSGRRRLRRHVAE
jgi:hypothetical protein